MGKRGHRAISGFLVLLLSAGLFLGLAPRPLLALSDEANDKTYHFGLRYLKDVVFDFGDVVVSPLHWKGKDLLLFGGVVAGTGLLALFDHEIKQAVITHNPYSIREFSLFITHAGEAPFLIGLSASLYISGEIAKSQGLRRTGLLTLESFAISGGIVTVLKFVFGRPRPTSNLGVFAFHPFSLSNFRHSFPSGHSASIFAAASVIAGEIDNPVLGAMIYGAAGLVAVSRIYNNEHWGTDIFVGSALGYFVGKMVLRLNRRSSTNSATLSAAPGPGGFSLSLRF